MTNCPKCAARMTTRHFGPDVAVEQCVNCYGLWIGGDTLRLMTELPMADVLDTGNVKTGARYDQIDDIDCPACHIPMTHARHPSQRHIGYEHCEHCDGHFLDAGELTDLKHYTFGDWFKSLLLPRSSR